jgi:hypothetical protein
LVGNGSEGRNVGQGRFRSRVTELNSPIVDHRFDATERAADVGVINADSCTANAAPRCRCFPGTNAMSGT